MTENITQSYWIYYNVIKSIDVNQNKLFVHVVIYNFIPIPSSKKVEIFILLVLLRMLHCLLVWTIFLADLLDLFKKVLNN